MPYTDEQITEMMDQADPEELLTLTLPRKDFRILLGLSAAGIVEIESDEVSLSFGMAMKYYSPQDERARRSASALIAGYNNADQVMKGGKDAFVERMTVSMQRGAKIVEDVMKLLFPEAMEAKEFNESLEKN